MSAGRAANWLTRPESFAVRMSFTAGEYLFRQDIHASRRASVDSENSFAWISDLRSLGVPNEGESWPGRAGGWSGFAGRDRVDRQLARLRPGRPDHPRLGVTGPLFGYSDTWQLVINTGTTIVTFLMVFLIQRSQNKDSHAVHLKLNELVAAVHGASNRLINVEDLSEDEVEFLRGNFQSWWNLAKRDEDLQPSHSIEEAEADHERKKGSRRRRGKCRRKRRAEAPKIGAPDPDAKKRPGLARRGWLIRGRSPAAAEQVDLAPGAGRPPCVRVDRGYRCCGRCRRQRLTFMTLCGG